MNNLDIQIVSDLHIEFYSNNNWDEYNLLIPSASILALLGDIGVCTNEESQLQYESFIKWCSERFDKVLFLAGNHEYYNHGTQCTTKDVDEFLNNLSATYTNTIFMNKTSVLINNVYILGTTLWSNIPNEAAGNELERFLNDYKLIYKKGKNCRPKVITSKDTMLWYTNQIEWLKYEINNSSKGIPIVVLTHHTPSMKGTSNPHYENNRKIPESYRNYGFSSSLDDIFKSCDKIICWAYGHTHYNNMQIKEEKTFLFSNQRGYFGSLCKNYNPKLIVKINSDCTEVNNIKLLSENSWKKRIPITNDDDL
jgi:hypothetical protein